MTSIPLGRSATSACPQHLFHRLELDSSPGPRPLPCTNNPGSFLQSKDTPRSSDRRNPAGSNSARWVNCLIDTSLLRVVIRFARFYHHRRATHFSGSSHHRGAIRLGVSPHWSEACRTSRKRQTG